VLEHTISDKIEIIVYLDISDLKQSNIGLEEAFTSSAGRTKIQGHKMFVYFDGDHTNLRKSIKRGIAEVYLNSILFGSSIQEIVQNALLLNLPEWFGQGISAYAGSPWDYEIDDEMRDLLTTQNKFIDFEKFAREHPRAAGHSMWYYISKNYGPSTIANIIYLTRINRNLENSFLFILGDDYKSLQKDWYSFYHDRYNLEFGRFEKTEKLNRIKFKNKKGVPVGVMKMSPDGSMLAYITNDKGKCKLYVRNLLDDSERMIFKTGYKNIFQETDFNYPLIAWHPFSKEITVVYEKRDLINLRKIYIPDKTYVEEPLTQDYQRIYSMDYVDNDSYVFSGTKDGYSDLYLYDSKLRSSKRLTEDFFDDLDASFIEYEGEASVLFRSNRTNLLLERQFIDTILPIETFDLYVLKGVGKNGELIKLTNTPDFSELSPILSGKNEVSYLKSETGILNAYALDLRDKTSVALTNLERNIIIHSRIPNSKSYFFSYYDKGDYKIFEKKIDENISVQPKSTVFSKNINKTKKEGIEIPLLPGNDDNEEILITEGMKFQSEFEDPPNQRSIESYVDEGEEMTVFEKYFKDYYSSSVLDGKRIIKYSPMRANISRLKFHLSDFTTRMDNSVLFEGLESYTGDDKELANTPVGILFKATIQDLFEDYDIQIGLRLPTSFNGYEYFGVFDNKKHLIDRRFAFYRKAETNISNPATFPVQREKRHTVLGMYQLKYPFNVYRSIRLTGTLRFDKYIKIAVDPGSLNEPFINEKRLSLKAEYVFDNSYDISTNILNGTRYKIYSEAINEFNLNFADGFKLDASKGFTGVFGFDARHYIPIFKHAVFALRATGATSVGSSKIVYYLGGMENWLFNKFDESIPIPSGDNFSYKALAPHLRGFKNNIRNGNTYVLSNAEIRIPIFRFLSKKPTGNSFFKNFQISGFFDAGLAWYGIGPNAEDNPLNTIEVSNPPTNPVITIEARYFRDPLVMGYGFGFRSTLLGYFVKFDYAWGIETGRVQEPRYYISLGTDF
jgi:WD40 repeat protein